MSHFAKRKFCVCKDESNCLKLFANFQTTLNGNLAPSVGLQDTKLANKCCFFTCVQQRCKKAGISALWRKVDFLFMESMTFQHKIVLKTQTSTHSIHSTHRIKFFYIFSTGETRLKYSTHYKTPLYSLSPIITIKRSPFQAVSNQFWMN